VWACDYGNSHYINCRNNNNACLRRSWL